LSYQNSSTFSPAIAPVERFFTLIVVTIMLPTRLLTGCVNPSSAWRELVRRACQGVVGGPSSPPLVADAVVARPAWLDSRRSRERSTTRVIDQNVRLGRSWNNPPHAGCRFSRPSLGGQGADIRKAAQLCRQPTFPVPILRLGLTDLKDLEMPLAAAPWLDHLGGDDVHEHLGERAAFRVAFEVIGRSSQPKFG
jgi:hypothetical protein